MADAPATPVPDPRRPFEIGLVMAGAISAGAYTAGVIDFLVEALDAWEEAKAQARQDLAAGKTTDCPMHEVKLRVMAGASAGGMTSGLAAGLLGMDYQSVLAQPTGGQMASPKNNNLYRSWVNTIDIGPLLGHKDLDAAGALPVQSVLDSSILLDIANDAFKFDSDERKVRPYVADPLHVILTVTNLRGVPYALDFMNFTKQQQYEMMMHADNMHFIVSATNPVNPGAFWLRPYQFNDPEWQTLEHSCLATGAFPFGLAPRLLARPPAQYQSREWDLTSPVTLDGKEYLVESWKTIAPTWPAIDAACQNDPAFQYQFLCVDGGVMNNEPLDLARRVLAGSDGVNPHEGDKAVRAVVMIMPFPNATPFDVKYPGQTNLFGLLTNTFNSLIAQARFDPQELALANAPDVYSRFLIVPRRGFRPDGTLETNTIACGSLQGFGGFLSRQFREHDYQLGRRNCQWFLQQYFVLPYKDKQDPQRNKLFDEWTDEARAKHAVHRAGWGADGTHKPAPGAQGAVLPVLPIVPLCGQAAVLIPETTWPTFTEDEFQALQPKIQDRLNRVVDALIDQNISGFFSRNGLKGVWWSQRGTAFTSIMNAIRTNLTTMGLMKKS